MSFPQVVSELNLKNTFTNPCFQLLLYEDDSNSAYKHFEGIKEFTYIVLGANIVSYTLIHEHQKKKQKQTAHKMNTGHEHQS